MLMVENSGSAHFSLSEKELALLEKNSDRMMELQRLQKHKEKDRFNELER